MCLEESVPLFDIEDLPELGQMKTFGILHDFSIRGQCLASVEQGGDDNGAEHRKFCSESPSVVVEYARAEFPKA